MAVKKSQPVKRRSDQGRNESKRGKVAGKGFVVARTTKNERKAQGKALGKMAAYAAPGGAAVKGALAAKKAVAAKKAAKVAAVKRDAKKRSDQAKRKYYNQRTFERHVKSNARETMDSSRFDDARDWEILYQEAERAALKRKPNLPKKYK